MAAEGNNRGGWLRRYKWPLLALHTLFWLALGGAAYADMGPLKASNCWHLLLFFLPPLQFTVIAIAVVSPIALIMSLFDAKVRVDPKLVLAWHGVILTLGLSGASYAAFAAAGPVACL
ncbi:hypothetical protein [Shinella sp. NM-101]|uniref:hypothetical protein n=1 Tax=Shinella sp. NM-101 TaxID=2744455 RepID=UPI001F412037|nr:hypothetical protein [Shinella sp. NM-101]